MTPPRHLDMRALPFRGKRSPEGRPLCSLCGTEVPPGRQSWCSQACVDAYLIRSSPQVARDHLWRRDAGVCAACGTDTEALAAAIRQARADDCATCHDGHQGWAEAFHGGHSEAWAEWAEVGEALLGPRWWRANPWDADHIVPVEDGGGACGLENLQTLCHPCHVAKTAEQARQRALRRRGQPELPKA